MPCAYKYLPAFTSVIQSFWQNIIQTAGLLAGRAAPAAKSQNPSA